MDSLIRLGMQCPNFKNMILELQLNEMNKHRKKKSKKKKNFPKDVTTTLGSAFYERYIPFMLFTSSMS